MGVGVADALAVGVGVAAGDDEVAAVDGVDGVDGAVDVDAPHAETSRAAGPSSAATARTDRAAGISISFSVPSTYRSGRCGARTGGWRSAGAVTGGGRRPGSATAPLAACLRAVALGTAHRRLVQRKSESIDQLPVHGPRSHRAAERFSPRASSTWAADPLNRVHRRWTAGCCEVRSVPTQQCCCFADERRMMLENPWGTRHSCQRTTCCRPLPVDCGEPGLDDHLRKQALLNHVQGGSRSSSPLATTQWWAIKPSRRQRSPVRRFPGKVRRNTPEPIPAILLARLAVDRKEQGQGVGAALLRDAVLRTVEAAEQVESGSCSYAPSTTPRATSASATSSTCPRPIRYTCSCSSKTPALHSTDEREGAEVEDLNQRHPQPAC